MTDGMSDRDDALPKPQHVHQETDMGIWHWKEDLKVAAVQIGPQTSSLAESPILSSQKIHRICWEPSSSRSISLAPKLAARFTATYIQLHADRFFSDAQENCQDT